MAFPAIAPSDSSSQSITGGTFVTGAFGLNVGDDAARGPALLSAASTWTQPAGGGGLPPSVLILGAAALAAVLIVTVIR